MPKKSSHRWNAAFAAALICLVVLPAGAAARSVSLPTLTLPTPSPGHATAEVLRLEITGRGATQNGNVFEATTPDRKSLPKSVRIFSAVRQIRTSSSVTWAFYLVAVNKRTSGAAAAGAGAAPAAASLVRFRSYPVTNNLHALVVRFTKPARGNGAAVGHGHALGHAIYCDSCNGDASVQAVVNVDAATPAVTAPLTAELKDLLSQNGATASIFRRVHVARYDNGHAFKAKEKGARAALRGVVDALIAQRPGDVLAKIEKALGAKIG